MNHAGVSNGINEKSLVYIVGTPSVHGIVMSVIELDDTTKYEVFVNGNIETFFSGQIALLRDETPDNWVDIDTFRSRMTAYQINNPLSRNLYSLNSARIDFVPYQFRPALKIIHADEPRILIADSVGVGKTIEAGLIIKELQARNDLETILIICPKPLVAERKWELEMKRFDEDFVPVDGTELRQIVKDTDYDGEWPIRYNKVIIPYSILNSEIYYGEADRKKKTTGLVNLDPAPHFDLVIVDEAHHIRNGSMEKDKAFEYKCVKFFCDNADAVVMLTATPLQTSDDDLYTLLNLLRPDVVIDKATFDLMSRPNSYISQSVRVMREADAEWNRQAFEILQHVKDTRWGENVIARNPVYSEVMQKLQQNEVSREERVRLIYDTESLHSFHSMLNRIRRKDIQDFCIRRSFTLASDFTDEQRALHDALLAFEYKALGTIHGNTRSVAFMMSTIKRQAASCIFGLVPCIEDLLARRFKQLNDGFDAEELEFEFDSNAKIVLTEMAASIVEKARSLSKEDPKFDLMMEAVREKQLLDNNKIIIFSTFRHTLAYLRERLQKEGLRVEQVDGSVKDLQRQSLRERFLLPKEDSEAIDILLFTEVGSEGLDYQFCNMMINYDLPWNPMRIEQRIGRIDRRGQKNETVNIYNMITNDTVDADIFYRCLVRIGVFENSIGDCDEILGELSERIDEIALDGTLSDEERRRKLEQIADNEVRQIQELNRLEEEEKEFFGLDVSEFTMSEEIRRAENIWITQQSLQMMIEHYLTERIGQGTYFVGNGAVKHLRLSASARSILREDLRGLPGARTALRQRWDNYLKGEEPTHTVTFDAEAAERDREAFFLTSMHPFSRQAASYFASKEKLKLHVEYNSSRFESGQYLFCVYAWNYVGVNPHTRMVVICEDDDIAKALPEILLEARSTAEPDIPGSPKWDHLEKKHISEWKREKISALDEADRLCAFKKESLSFNFLNLKRSLEQRMADTTSDKLRRMFEGQLQSATRRFEEKSAELELQAGRTDIHTTLIANGILDIKE